MVALAINPFLHCYKPSGIVFMAWVHIIDFVGSTLCWGDFSECHDDFDLNPPDGVLKPKHSSFNWLGFIRYLHVELSAPHPILAPRAVLIHRQFVLATAVDVNQPPKNYKVGYLVFGQYEREEADCQLKQSQAKMGLTCGRAYMEIPHSQIINHPEYSRFGVRNSLTLLKLISPMLSRYMVPVCLPSMTQREKQRKLKTVIMIDYISSVPEDFSEENMGKKTLKLLTRRECDIHRRRSSMGKETAATGITHYLCTSGCGMRLGTPIITHAANGPFELIGMIVNVSYCTEKIMRSRLNNDPPLYIDIYPYVTWLTNVITAHIIPHAYPSKVLDSDDEGISGRRLMPSGRVRGSLRTRVKQKQGWVRRIYKVGNYCYKRKSTQSTLAIFYIEKFEVLAGGPSRLRVFTRISAGIECTIVCARIALPNRLARPIVEGVGGFNISIEFTTDWFPFHFYFKVGLMGINTTEEDAAIFLMERPKPGYWYDKKK